MAGGDQGPGPALNSYSQTLSTFLSNKEAGPLKSGKARQEAPAALGGLLDPSFLPPFLASHFLHGGGPALRPKAYCPHWILGLSLKIGQELELRRSGDPLFGKRGLWPWILPYPKASGFSGS